MKPGKKLEKKTKGERKEGRGGEGRVRWGGRSDRSARNDERVGRRREQRREGQDRKGWGT